MIEVDFPTRGPGYLVLSLADDALRHATKLYLTDNIAVTEDDTPLPPPRVVYARVSLPSDKSFASYEQARAHASRSATADDLELYWNQQFLTLPNIPSDPTTQFAIRFKSDRLGAMYRRCRFLPPGGAVRASIFTRSGLVRLIPAGTRRRALVVPPRHILEGTDHLLFPVCPSSCSGAAAADHHRHLVHGREFHCTDRLRARFRARGAGFATGRDADHRHHRSYGAGEHRLCGAEQGRQR